MTESSSCLGKVWDGWRHLNCSRAVKRDGFCTQHHPETIAKRRAEQDARYAEKQAMRNARYDAEKEQKRRADCFDDLLAALGRLLNDSMFKDHPEASQMAIDAIIKATGEHP